VEARSIIDRPDGPDSTRTGPAMTSAPAFTGCGPPWRRWATRRRRRRTVAHLTGRMLDAAAPQPGDRVLELACGPGGAGLAVRSGSPRMARSSSPTSPPRWHRPLRPAPPLADSPTSHSRARPRTIEADASYDVVLCREGLMFAPDPARAAEISRVLRPGGRSPSRRGFARPESWLGLLMGAVSAEIGAPEPLPRAAWRELPQPRIPGLLPRGFRAARRSAQPSRARGRRGRRLPVPLRAGSFDQWWERSRPRRAAREGGGFGPGRRRAGDP
jgi:SAM-dependent methyltransferase